MFILYSTDVSIFLWEASENPTEYCIYRDFRSLYPHTCRMFSYPTGTPQIISRGQFLSENWKISDIFGPITCALDPPRKRLFPCIPVKINSRLMFPLCRTCAERKNQNECTCTVLERRIYGTWVHVEVQVWTFYNKY